MLRVCDAAAAGTSSETMTMMDEMSRLGAMWEEAWHATLAELQVGMNAPLSHGAGVQVLPARGHDSLVQHGLDGL